MKSIEIKKILHKFEYNRSKNRNVCEAMLLLCYTFSI